MSFPRFFAAAFVLTGGAAMASPQLLASNPPEQAAVAPPPRLELNFSEKLLAASSAAKLTMTSMLGMAGHPPMAMAVAVSASEDPKTMVITPKQPLPPGTYRIDWRAVSSDATPVTGAVNFTVK